MAIASRTLYDASFTITAYLHRKIIGSIFNILIRLLIIDGIHDTQCGFKLFTDTAAKSFSSLQQTHGFGFDVELLFIGKTKCYRISEVPINWADTLTTKVKVVLDSWKMFTDLLKSRYRDLLGLYDDTRQ